MKYETLFNKSWKLLHVFSILMLLVLAAKAYSFSHTLDVHYPDMEERVEQDRNSDPNIREIELDNGESVVVYDA